MKKLIHYSTAKILYAEIGHGRMNQCFLTAPLVILVLKFVCHKMFTLFKFNLLAFHIYRDEEQKILLTSMSLDWFDLSPQKFEWAVKEWIRRYLDMFKMNHRTRDTIEAHEKNSIEYVSTNRKTVEN